MNMEKADYSEVTKVIFCQILFCTVCMCMTAEVRLEIDCF